MNDVLDFWFTELTPREWFKKSAELDARIKQKFALTHRQVTAGETWEWRATATGRLAEILVLDQFSRNMFRGTAAAFASDSLALALAQEAVRCEADKALDDQQRVFLYMPYMHSESVTIHKEAVKLFGETANLDYELRHKAIVDRFGRYPHRNEALGRTSTPEELAWMSEHSGF